MIVDFPREPAPAKNTAQDKTWRGMQASVLIVEDHSLTAHGLQALIGDTPDVRVVGTATTADEARKLVKVSRPTVITLDLRIDGSTAVGIQLARDFREMSPNSRILVCSAFASDGDVATLVDIGIDGYVIKSEPLNVIAGAIRTLAGGQTFYSRPVSLIMQRALRGRDQELISGAPSLGSDELDTLRLVAKGLTNEEIAERLFVSRTTVTRRLATIFQVLDVKSRAEAVAKAAQIGYLDAAS